MGRGDVDPQAVSTACPSIYQREEAESENEFMTIAEPQLHHEPTSWSHKCIFISQNVNYVINSCKSCSFIVNVQT